MAEEKEVKESAEVNQESTEKVETEKNSNRTFTQSEHDAAIKRVELKFNDKLKQFDHLQTEIEKLQKEKEEKEMAEMSELEKLTKQLEKERETNKALEEQANKLEKVNLKNRVLSDAKFNELPRPYKELVQGSNEEEISQSAEKMLNEYKIDFEGRTSTAKNISLPNNLKKQDSGLKEPLSTPKSIGEAINKKIKSFVGISG